MQYRESTSSLQAEVRALLARAQELLPEKEAVKVQVIPSEQAKLEYDIDLPEGWFLKLQPDVEAGQYKVSYLTSSRPKEQWEIKFAETGEARYYSPEGRIFTQAELEKEEEFERLHQEEMASQYQLAQQTFGGVEGATIRGLPIPKPFTPTIQYGKRDPVTGELMSVTEAELTTYRPPPREAVISQIEDDPDAFLNELRKIGRTTETEALLKQVFPEITPEELNEILPRAITLSDFTDEYIKKRGGRLTSESNLLDLPPGQERELMEEFNQLTREARAEFVKQYGEEAAITSGIAKLFAPPKQVTGVIAGLPPSPIKTLAGSFVAGGAIPFGGAGGVARYLGSKGSEFEREVTIRARALEKFAPTGISEKADFWHSKIGSKEFGDKLYSFFLDKSPRLLPFTLALIPIGLAGGAVGTAVAGAMGLTGIGITIATAVGGGLFSTTADSLVNAGEVFDSLVAEGKTEDEARKAANKDLLMNFPRKMLANTIEFTLAFVPMSPALMANPLIKVVFSPAGKIIGGSLAEGIDEDLDEITNKLAKGEEIKIDDDLIEVFALAAFSGAIFQGIGEVSEAIGANPMEYLTASLENKRRAEADRLVAQGLPENIANATALDKVLHTDEGKAWLAKILPQIKEGLGKLVASEEGGIKLPEGEQPGEGFIIARNTWATMTASQKSEIVKKVGLTEEVASKEWAKLANWEKGRLLGQPIPLARLEAEPAQALMPQPVVGMPEAGVQTTMEGELVPVTPKGKGVVTQISMEDQLKLQQARADAEIEGISAFLEEDPVAQYRFQMGTKITGRKGGVRNEIPNMVGLESLISIREQGFPNYFTVKQAQALNPHMDFSHYLIKGTKEYNHVPAVNALDEIAEHLGYPGNVSGLADRVMQIRRERARIRKLQRSEISEIEEYIPEEEEAPTEEALPAMTEEEVGEALSTEEAPVIEPINKGRWQELPQGVKTDKPTQVDLASGKTFVWLEAGETLPTAPTGEPPVVPPEKPPTAPSPAKRAVPPLPVRRNRIVELVTEQVRQKRPGLLTRTEQKIPGLKQIVEYLRPGLKMTGEYEGILVAMLSEKAARSYVGTKEFYSRLLIQDELRNAFGKEVLRGAVSDVSFIGTAAQRQGKGEVIIGTLLDMIHRAPLYALNYAQKQAILTYDAWNKTMLPEVTEGFGADIGEYQMRSGGYWIPNWDTGEDVVAMGEREMRKVASGMAKTRIWDTAFERMNGETPFTPELDVQKLMEGISTFRAGAAGGMTYKSVIGGLTRLEAMMVTHPALHEKMMGLRAKLQRLQGYKGILKEEQTQAIADFLASGAEDIDLLQLQSDLDVKLEPGRYVAKSQAGKTLADIQSEIDAVRADIRDLKPAWKAANLKPYVFVQNGIYRYFEADVANLINESRQSGVGWFIKLLEFVRGAKFSGDFSPILGIQTPVGVLFDPFGAIENAAGAINDIVRTGDVFRSVKQSALASDISLDPESWSEFAALVGYPPSGTPKEYAGGWLSLIPGYTKANSAMYILVTRQAYDMYKRDSRAMIQDGMAEDVAKVAAADAVMEVYPNLNPTRQGLSPGRAAILGALPTSYSYIMQTAQMTGDAAIGYAKLATLQKLTPRESLSVKRMTTFAISVLVVSAVSAMLTAKAKGRPDDEVLQAGLDAINPYPYNPNFLSIIIGDLRIPIGGPYRGLFRAIYPQEVKGIPFPVPFAGIVNYLGNRITPFIKTQFDLIRNKDYYGRPILKGDPLERLIRGIAYELEGIFPLTISAVTEGIRTGEKPKNIVQRALGQLAGVNVSEVTSARINDIADDAYWMIGKVLDSKYLDPLLHNVGEKPPLYTMKNVREDILDAIGARPLDGITLKKGYDPRVVFIAETELIRREMEYIPNIKLKDINTDPAKGDTITNFITQWQKRQLITDPDELKEFDADNPQARYGNISSGQLALLTAYQLLHGDKIKQSQFVTDHPDLNLNPYMEYLKANPEENGRMVLTGQGKPLTQAAYDYILKMAKELNISPDALGNLLPPKEVAKASFEYMEAVDKFGGSSAEAKLIRAKNPLLETWFNSTREDDLEPITTPIEALELKVKNRGTSDLIESWDDKDKDKDGLTARDRAVRDLRATKEGAEYYDDLRRIEAWTEGADRTVIEDWVGRGRLVDLTSGGSAKVKQFMLEHPDLLEWASTKDNPVHEDWRDWDKRVIDIDVEYEKDDAWYADLGKRYDDMPDWKILEMPATKSIDPDKWATMDAKARRNALKTAERDYYLNINKKYHTARIQRDGYKDGLPDEFIPSHVEYNMLPTYGAWRDRYYQQNPGYYKAVNDARLAKGLDPLAKLPEKIPLIQYDMIYEEYKDQFERYEKIKGNDSAALRQRKDFFKADPEFQKAWYRRKAYSEFIPEGYAEPGASRVIGSNPIDDYVAYHILESEGRPENWQSISGAELPWYEEEWWMIDHLDYYREVYRGIQGHAPKDYRMVPTRDVFAKYLVYVNELSSGKPREDYRRANPDLEEWLLRTGRVTQPIGEKEQREGLTPAEITAMEVLEIMRKPRPPIP